MMEITVPGADRVEARYDGLVIQTAQDGRQPAPFDLFLASIGTCAGHYAARFCRQRGLDTRGLRILQEVIRDPETRMVERVRLSLELPPGFPDKYRAAIVRAAGQCTVKKHLASPPEIVIEANSADHTPVPATA